MQQPPIDLRMPKSESEDLFYPFPTTAALVIVALIVAVGVGIYLSGVHEDHAWHGDRAPTDEYIACLRTTTTVADVEACKPVMPWYAAHPFWYAAIVGLAAFVIGRVGLFMVRMERARGY